MKKIIDASKENNPSQDSIINWDEVIKGGELNDLKHFVEEHEFDIINYVNHQGVNALHMAVYWGHLEIVKYLVEKGANINYVIPKNGNTALLTAASCGHLEVVKYLI